MLKIGVEVGVEDDFDEVDVGVETLDDVVEEGVEDEGEVKSVRLSNEAVPVYSVPQTVALMPFVGGELPGAEKAVKSAPVMIERGLAAMRGMGDIVEGRCRPRRVVGEKESGVVVGGEVGIRALQ